MPDWITVDLASASSGWAVVVGIAIAQIRGVLVSSRQVDRLETAYQSQVANEKARADAATTRADATQAQLNRLLEAAYPVLRTVTDEMA